jgi:hypothetical protein
VDEPGVCVGGAWEDELEPGTEDHCRAAAPGFGDGPDDGNCDAGEPRVLGLALPDVLAEAEDEGRELELGGGAEVAELGDDGAEAAAIDQLEEGGTHNGDCRYMGD